MTAWGTHVLLQSFTVPLASPSVTLSFDMYVYDWYGAGAAVDPSGLDHTTGGTNQPNQHARVDLLSAGADPFDTGSGVLAIFYLGVDPEAAAGLAPFYRSYLFNLTGLALPGGTYQLRFGMVDNQFVLNQGVDNVVLAARPTGVILEPGAWVFMTAGSLSVLTCLRFSKRCALHRRRKC